MWYMLVIRAYLLKKQQKNIVGSEHYFVKCIMHSSKVDIDDMKIHTGN